MKKLLLCIALIAGASQVNAQLPDGSIAPDFTVTDINGNSHNLYTYLDQGYTVIMDLNATWCPPCWSYHTGGALEEVWNLHGPAGQTGVSAGTTDDVIVMMIESDNSTTNDDLNGTGGNTEGDWVTGTDFIIIDDASVASAYALAYYPTIYTVCPNRVLQESGQASATAHYANVTACPIANGTNNPGLLGYTGETSSCAAIDVTVDLMNMGTANLTSATIELKDGATVLNTVNWTGNLATYGMENVNVGSVTPTTPTTYTIEITSTDDNASDNTLTQLLSPAPQASGVTLTVEIETDYYGSETTWEMRDGSNNVIGSGGPYADLTTGQPGTTVQPAVDVTAPANDCITFTVFDSYGDGMDAGYGAGNYAVKDGSTTLISGGVFADDESGKIKSGVAALDELNMDNVNIYPNPATDVLNVTLVDVDSEYTVAIMDLSGRVIATSNGSTAGSTVTFPVADLANGSYIVTVATETAVYTENVVIK